MVCPVWHTYRAHRTVIRSKQMNFCTDYLRRAICSTIRMPSFLDRQRSVCIDTIPDHMPDILNLCIRPYSTRTLYCKLFCSAYFSMADIVAFCHCNSWDHGNHYHHDISPQISMCNYLCSTDPGMDCTWPAVLMCMAVYRDSDVGTSDNSSYLCSLLPTHNRIPRPDRRRRCRKSSVVALQMRNGDNVTNQKHE